MKKIVLLALFISLAIVSPVKAATWELNGFNEDKWSDTSSWTLSYASSNDDYRSPIARTFCLLVHVRPGDLVNVNSESMFVNANQATGWWGVRDYTGNWVQSEHWGLYVMQGNAVNAGVSCGDRRWDVIYWQDANWDNWAHYYNADRSLYWKVPTDASIWPDPSVRQAVYISAWAYFVASKNYVIGNPTITLDATASKMQVAVFNQP